MKTKFLLPLTASLLLAACGGGTPASSSSQSQSSSVPSSSSAAPSSQAAQTYKVTFHLNYDGAKDLVVDVEEGKAVNEPNGIVREGYLFNGWYTDAACTNAYDLATPVTSALDLYAAWVKDDGNTISCVFYYNLEGQAEVYQTVYFEKGGRMTNKPADPQVSGYSFRGWYKEKECINEFSLNARYDESQSAYAKWFKTYTFEAEYTQFTDLPEDDNTANEFGEKIGQGYSSNVYGLGLIFKDDDKADCKASNGYYVTDLYYYGAYLEFDVASDKDVNDAVLIARLTAEYFDMTFSPDNYTIEVNGEAINYQPIAINNVITGRDNPKKRDFSNFNITSSLSLKKGNNVIKMITKNSTKHDAQGTMNAEAPMIDCLYAYSDAALTFDAHTDNIK